MLERQQYPDLRLFPGGPPKPPYDVTGHTLGMLMGVEVDQVDRPFEASLVDVTKAEPPPSPSVPPGVPHGPTSIGPESNAAFMAVARLQAANVPVFRAAQGFDVGSPLRAWHVDRSGHSGGGARARRSGNRGQRACVWRAPIVQ